MRSADFGAPDEPPRVAYAVPRAVGGAVARNRLRRQMQAVVRSAAGELRSGRGYLLRALPEARTMTYRDIEVALRALFAQSEAKSA